MSHLQLLPVSSARVGLYRLKRQGFLPEPSLLLLLFAELRLLLPRTVEPEPEGIFRDAEIAWGGVCGVAEGGMQMNRRYGQRVALKDQARSTRKVSLGHLGNSSHHLHSTRPILG